MTEHCYKHTPAAMHALLALAGWRPRQVFTAPTRPFRMWLCEPHAAASLRRIPTHAEPARYAGDVA